MGPIAHIVMDDRICQAVRELLGKNVLKNGQINVRIVKYQGEIGKTHSYHDTCLRALILFLYEIFR